MFEQKIVMKQNTSTTAEAFGVSPERQAEVFRKLIAIAKLYPRYSIIAESFLNCEDRFTEMERLYGLYELGKIKGAAGVMRRVKIQIKYDTSTMPLEGKLLSILSKHVVVENKILNKLLTKEKLDARPQS